MKHKLSRSFVIAVCFCFCVLSAGAQSRDEKTPPSLDEAARKLNDAVQDKTIPLSKGLNDAVVNFLAAAKTPQDREKLDRATRSLDTALKAEQQQAEAHGKTFARRDKVIAIETAITAAKQVLNPEDKTSGTPTPPGSASPLVGTGTGGEGDKELGLTGLLVPVAGGIGAAAAIVLLVFAVLRLRRGYWARFDHHVNGVVKAHSAELKQRQDELVKHMNALANQNRNGSTRLESIESELQALGRRVRGMSGGRGYQGDATRQAFDEYSRPQPVPVEPEFPASVSDYLSKMKRNSTVVKPDFQNGILVSDLDGKGELVLIRDTRVADSLQSLFLVPRVGQFQTKQEFHSYYERYYECQRPSAGDVWIIDPAIVSTVPGGWELREKGVLEVR